MRESFSDHHNSDLDLPSRGPILYTEITPIGFEGLLNGPDERIPPKYFDIFDTLEMRIVYHNSSAPKGRQLCGFMNIGAIKKTL